jgi:hypothetical protein
MTLSFVETMRGTLRDAAGAEHPVSFEVTASSRGRGRFDLRGVISAPPFAPEAVAEGTLTIAPFLRAITYRLRFQSRDGAMLGLEAEKHPTPTSPLKSMTEMDAELFDAQGRLLAHGRMLFDLADLPRFAASWLPVAREQQKRLDVRRRAIARQLLGGG